ncbi:CRISPR-associated protein Cas4 [Halosimplex amylolyticum]|uniref:CRISPR-associated protein Cas4 n=1 Tax=Halosimplex amylolyticum TaxID=3396616 RepID=UPI003F5653BA
MHTFRDLATAAYCPRKLYYRHRDPAADDDVPQEVRARRDLAFRYRELLESDPEIQAAPIEVTPTQYRSRLGRLQATLDAWDDLVDPAGREVVLEGRECRGVAHKVLEGPPRPSLVFAGAPPEQGVWEPQTARLVAAAKALAWERETTVETAFAEYPAYGVVREVPLTTRRKATYRSAVRTADAIDGPPSRTSNRQKCSPCEYQGQCGVVTRSLKSML